MMIPNVYRLILTGLIATIGIAPCFALDYVTATVEGKEREFEGRIFVEDTGGNIVFEERDGQWHIIKKEDIIKRHEDDKEFVPYTKEELKKRIIDEFPKTFRIYETKRYLVVYDTSKAYAQWCGTLLERLDTAFLAHWQKKGLELREPEFVMVAVIFADRGNFLRCTGPEVGSAVDQIAAYYNQFTNRIVFYDLTGQENGNSTNARISNRRIQEFLSRPDSAKSVSTFIHEATHQISFNSGLQQRFGANPIWVSEGIAMLFETPDYNTARAWTSGIKVNHRRLDDFVRYINEHHPKNVMLDVIESDDPFRIITSTQSAIDAYSTAWSMMCFFNAKKSDQLIEYLKVISEKKPFNLDDEATRRSDFETAFGDDWAKTLKEFFRYLNTL